MTVLRSFFTALATFSRIPSPKSDFREDDLRYVMGFLPIVGIIIYLVIYLWVLCAGKIGFDPLLVGVVAAVIPILIVGGLHADGFADVIDAVSSRADREKKKEILKDPHIGTFAVVGLIVYYLLFAVLSISYFFNAADPLFLGAIFILSRGIVVPFAFNFPLMSENGFLATVRAGASRTASMLIALIIVLACALYLAYVSYKITFISLVACVITDIVLAFRCRRHFGGINGDCIGYMIQYSELVMLAAVVVGMVI